MDLVTGLPESEGKNAILVIVDRLSKMAHFAAVTTELSSKELADIFRDLIWRLHGIPYDIVSDRGTIFISQFWKELCQLLGTRIKPSTAFHPQTDGQTERTNSTMEQYLRGYVNYQQDDWTRWLTTAEFSYNNSLNKSTGISPFAANYGFNPNAIEAAELAQAHRTSKEPQQILEQLAKLQQATREELKRSQEIQKEQANKKRIPAPSYKPGDKVWLDARYIRTERPAKKLEAKMMGPFQILKSIGQRAYKLDLPPSMKIHPVFHVHLLHPASTDPYPGQQHPEPPPIQINDHEEYEVEDVFDSRIRYKKLQYLVKWRGYARPDWEPAHHLANCPDTIARFHSLYPAKPGVGETAKSPTGRSRKR
jgi:hypothetical protein